MSRLTQKELRLILEAFAALHGVGYSKDLEIAKLQTKLSIMLQMASTRP